jgi:hypothetical protein
MSYRVEVAGRFAHAALSAGEGEVCALFRRSFYLRIDDKYVCIGDASLGRGPLNALVADFHPPAMGEHIRVSLDAASTWAPRPLNGAARPNIQALRVSLDGHVPQDGFGCTILGVENALSVHAQPAIEALERWLAGHALGADVEQLIGLGPGLTPSGDDYLGGVLIGLRWLGRGAHADSLWRWLEPRLAARTSAISAAHLAAAAAGEGHEALHEVMENLAAWETPSLTASLGRLDAVGHTSGWDALAGIVAVARSAS